jgi:hypothetical protein
MPRSDMQRMRPTEAHNTHLRAKPQRGFAIIIIMVLASIVLATVLLGYISSHAAPAGTDPVTLAALVRARDTLIARAATDNTIPGSLPCPDVDNDGQLTAVDQVAGNCTSFIGRLPWKTLGVPDLRDSSGERLWYALSSNFRNNPAVSPLNSESVGQLTVTGSNPASNVIAIVFAPGQALNGQLRDVASQTNVTNYLEGENANGDTIFTMIASSSAFNDSLLSITSDVLFPAVEARVARDMRYSLNAYYATNGYFPYASDYSDGTFNCIPGQTRGRLPRPGLSLALPLPAGAHYDISFGCPGLADWPSASRPLAWFSNNGWNFLTYYTIAAACTQATLNCSGAGYLTVANVPAPVNDKRALVIVSGRALAGQTRPSVNVADYFENENTTILDDVYVKRPVSPTFNDKVTIVAP